MAASTLVHPVTFNTNHGSDADEIRPVFKKVIRLKRPNVWLLQEVQRDGDGILPMLENEFELGWRHAEPEFAVAWDRSRFRFHREYTHVMSDAPYWAAPNRALVVVLEDLATGRRLKTMTYHPPAHVQAPGHVTHENVMRVLREFDAKKDRIARHSKMACAFGGDLNVDIRRGWEPKGGWGFLTDGQLDFHYPPKGTHGKDSHGRRIDPLETKLLRPAGDAWVLDGGKSDHNPHGRPFRYDPRAA